MQTPLRTRPEAAKWLNSKINYQDWTTKTLAKAARVTEVYVDYLRNFAETEDQVLYLVRFIDENPKHNPMEDSVWITVSVEREIKRKLKQGNMTGFIVEKFLEYYEEYKSED